MFHVRAAVRPPDVGERWGRQVMSTVMSSGVAEAALAQPHQILKGTQSRKRRLKASKGRGRIQVEKVMKHIPASLPAGEVPEAGPASALSVLSASASLSLKHRLQNSNEHMQSRKYCSLFRSQF